MIVKWVLVAGVAVLIPFVWGTDRVTLQSERTVYTVDCLKGAWQGNRCSGELAAGARYRYRALKNRGEVLFWVLGSPEPSVKLSQCVIQDGRNWTCPVSTEAEKSITLVLVHGQPARHPAWPARPIHSVSKLSWTLLNLGLKFSQSADSI